MQPILRALDYLFLTRPILFFPGWATMMAGYLAARGELHLTSILEHGLTIHGAPEKLLHAGAYLAFAMGSGAILNQIHDIESDTLNSKLFILGKGCVSVRHAYIESVLLLALSIVLAWWLNTASGLMLIFSLFWAGYVYNFRPFAFKNYPIRGLIANMGMGWSVFVMGWLAFRPFDLEGLYASLPYLFYNTALYLITTLPDLEGDRETGKQTIAVVYGLKATLWYSLGCLVLAILSAAWLRDALLFLVGVTALPFLIPAVISGKVAPAVRAVKLGIFFFSIGICIKFPGFLVMIVAAYVLTRYYYKRRFDYDYPNFKGQ
ncbi:MAG: UbiA family prenyltransferase [Calditrichia bacterium]